MWQWIVDRIDDIVEAFMDAWIKGVRLSTAIIMLILGIALGMWLNDIPWGYDALGLWIFALPLIPALLALVIWAAVLWRKVQ